MLHTSDWHLGRTLYSKKDRQEEQAAFLNWILTAINDYSVDLLIVAGDVFDNSSPGNSAQKMYYDFLLKVSTTGCQQVVIVGGNHDSPGFLNAPKEILAAIHIHVIGNVSENLEEELVTLKDMHGNPMAIVCAVPFLRERDVSRFTEGESYSDRSKRVAESIKNHYMKIAELAENMRKSIQQNIPIIATGHLSVAGGKTVDDDGVRDIYIGNIECIGSEIFSPVFDYVALGHYHISSVIDKNIRYCGSPIPMGFGEVNQKKSVFIVDFDENKPSVTSLDIPVFQEMESIRGDKSYLHDRLTELKKANRSVWVELIYEDDDLFPDLTMWATEMTAQTKIEIIKLQNRQYLNEVLTQSDSTQALEELNVFDVFDKLLEKNDFSIEKNELLKNLYREITTELSIEKQ